MTVLREILARFGFEVDDTELKHGHASIDGMIASLTHMGHAVLGAFAWHAAEKFMDQVVDGAREMNRAAIVAGVSAQNMQEFEHAANMSGVSAELMRFSLVRMQRSLFEAAQGAGNAAKSYTLLGVQIKDSAGKPRDTIEVFEDIAEKIAEIKDPAEQTGLAMRLFGRSGAQLLPMLKKGREGIAEYRHQVEELGGGFTDTFIETAGKVKRDQKEMAMLWRSISVHIATALVPAHEALEHVYRTLGLAVISLDKNIGLTSIAMAAFITYGVAKLPTLISLVGGFGKSVLLSILPWVLLGVAIEDVIGLFTGKESVTGTILDKVFGEGAADKFVEACTLMTTNWKAFHDTLGATISAGVKEWVIDLTKWFWKMVEAFAELALLLPKLAGFSVLGLLTGKGAKEGAKEGWENWKAGLAKRQGAIDRPFDRIKGDVHTGYEEEMAQIKDAAERAQIMAHRDAQLNQSLPMIHSYVDAGGQFSMVPQTATMSAPPRYMTDARAYTDRSNTTINLMPGSTDKQAREVAAVEAKVRKDRGDHRFALDVGEHSIE